MAKYLGVTALARLLGTDFNTLLSFKDNLSKKEVVLFIQCVVKPLALAMGI